MNVDITLPDGSVRNYASPVTGYQIAESIGPRLLKDAICVEIDNKFQDLSFEISIKIFFDSILVNVSKFINLFRISFILSY